MVEGQRGAMCIDCVPVTVSAFEGPDSIALTMRVLLDVLARHNPKSPLTDSRRLLDAIAMLANGEVSIMRQLVWQAVRLSCFDAALELAERLPATDRTPTDVINVAFAATGWAAGNTGSTHWPRSTWPSSRPSSARSTS